MSTKQSTSIHIPLDEGTYFPQDSGNVTWVDIDQSMGKKLAMHIITYPPGIPVYLKGERITKNMIKLMREYLQKGDRVEGIKQEKY